MRITYSDHAKRRMTQRGITNAQVLDVLCDGVLAERHGSKLIYEHWFSRDHFVRVVICHDLHVVSVIN